MIGSSFDLGEWQFLFQLLLFPAGALAGMVNVIAGGGSFLTLPLLIATGLPVDVANGTNRISVVTQGLYATADFRRKGAFDAVMYRQFLPWLLAGAILGAYAATLIDPEKLKRIFGIVFVMMGSYLLLIQLRSPEKSEQASQSSAWLHRIPLRFRYSVLLLIGVYGGFIQAGVGLWILLAGSTLLGLDTVKVNAIKLPLTLTFTIPALIIFLSAEMVSWVPGLILAAGTVAGTRIGVGLSIQGGHKLIMRAVTVVLLITGLHLLLFR